ncbi:hypothetical protein E3N88_04638 [Mikania micrantha]|uniref:DUF4408 domain-containing protein n=1 Tax=Mikania micrantha TaxID=192012 RepID=A0A5N6PXT2_9ASTR|nr:hypothetical protein E3N88_04638 [Mikania micrantha]
MLASSSGNSWIFSLKILLIFAGVVSVAVTGKLAVPVMFNFAVNDLPVIWSAVVSWLKPPYLYVIINGIIITIVASNRFQHNHLTENQYQQQVSYNPSNVLPPSDLTSELPPVEIHLNSDVMVDPTVAYEDKHVDTDVETVTVESTWNPSQIVFDSPPPPLKVQPEFNFPVREKRLVTSRFAHNRKPAKNIPEGARALRVLKPKKHETMDNTWKMITENRRMPSTMQFRKSDTIKNLRFDRPSSDESSAPVMTKEVRKSETIKDRTSYENQNHDPQPPALKLKKNSSLSDDELNRRVEAFIKKFNEDMRLQRQESLDQYLEMVDCGAR